MFPTLFAAGIFHRNPRGGCAGNKGVVTLASFRCLAGLQLQFSKFIEENLELRRS